MDKKERRNRTLIALSWGVVGLVGVVTGFSGLGVRSNFLSFALLMAGAFSIGFMIVCFNGLKLDLKLERDV